jgi:glycerol-3-phosphate acyltransferase PlsY
MLDLLITLILAYLLGSLMGGVLLRPLSTGVDLRATGSGNLGATNALRAGGARFAAAVALFDIGKGILAVALLPVLTLPGVEPVAVEREWVQAMCGVAVVVGHVWPIWHRFHGGKGAATLVGAVAVIAPMALLPILAVWVLVLVLSGYVGLATVLAALSGPVYALLVTGWDIGGMLFTFMFVMALTIVYTHRSNLSRLARGQENRFERAMIFRRHG